VTYSNVQLEVNGSDWFVYVRDGHTVICSWKQRGVINLVMLATEISNVQLGVKGSDWFWLCEGRT
jgi:hypothetical protein